MKLKKLIKPVKVILIVLMCILGLLAFIAVYDLGYKLLLGGDYSYLFGYTYHKVNENNMFPDYRINDVVILERNSSYQTDDIILYKYYGSYKLARIKDLSAGKYFLEDKGSTIDDSYEVTNELIVGRVYHNFRSFAVIFSIITSPLTILLFMLCIGGYFFLTLGDRG